MSLLIHIYPGKMDGTPSILSIAKETPAVIVQCKKATSYFASVTTYFRQINLIEENNYVVIKGTAEFFRYGKRIEFISACGVYEFDSDTKLTKMTSYSLIDNKDLKK